MANIRTDVKNFREVSQALRLLVIALESGEGFTIPDGSITTAKLANLAVTAAKIAADTITAAKIAPDAIGASELGTDAVDNDAIANDAVDTAEIATDAITLAKMGNASVGTTELVGSSVTAAKLPLLTRQRIPGLDAITKEGEGTPGADDIRFTIQAIDHNNTALTARASIDVWVSNAGNFGAPAGTHTITISTGTLIAPAAIGNTEAFRVLSDATGKVVVVVNVTGAGSRSVMASINGSQVQATAGTWV